MKRSLRTFIAIPFAPETKSFLVSLQSQFEQYSTDIKWVKPENIHLTLRFLGDISPKKASSIIKAFPKFFSSVSSFATELPYLGAFPNFDQPRIIWVGCSRNADKIKHLASLLEMNLNQLGLRKEAREFAPHITLGRIKNRIIDKGLTTALRNFSISTPEKVNIQKIIYYKSTLTAKGPIYEPLAEFNFSNKISLDQPG